MISNNILNSSTYSLANRTGENLIKNNNTNKNYNTKNNDLEKTEEAVIYEKSNNIENKEDYVEEYEKMYNEKISELKKMSAQAELKYKNFELLVSNTFKKQADKAFKPASIPLSAYSYNHESLSLNAKNFAKFNEKYDEMNVNSNNNSSISENGYYGIKQTSERIINFAKSVAGNDKEKLAKMKDAVEQGFKKAEKMWGEKLPLISQKTYEKVMSEFDNLLQVSPK